MRSVAAALSVVGAGSKTMWADVALVSPAGPSVIVVSGGVRSGPLSDSSALQYWRVLSALAIISRSVEASTGSLVVVGLLMLAPAPSRIGVPIDAASKLGWSRLVFFM